MFFFLIESHEDILKAIKAYQSSTLLSCNVETTAEVHTNPINNLKSYTKNKEKNQIKLK